VRRQPPNRARKSSGGGRPRLQPAASPNPHLHLTEDGGVRGRGVQGGRQRPFGQAADPCARQPDSNVHRPIFFSGTLTSSLCSATQGQVVDWFTSPTLSCAFKHSSPSRPNRPVPSFGCRIANGIVLFFFLFFLCGDRETSETGLELCSQCPYRSKVNLLARSSMWHGCHLHQRKLAWKTRSTSRLWGEKPAPSSVQLTRN
jgi:hypothetical protein